MTGRPDSLATLRAACAEDPIVLVDVGARGGLQRRWKPLAGELTWVGFEPDARSADALSPDDVPARSHVLQVALSDRRGTVRLHRTRDEGDSSLLVPNRAFLDLFGRPERFDVVDTVEWPADTLDSQLGSLGIRAIDVLKLDTQGTELQILHGASETLAQGVLAVDIEVEFSPMYSGQALFSDVDPHLRLFGLQLMDLVPKRWTYAGGEHLSMSRGQLVWGEAIYLPTLESAMQRLSSLAETSRATALQKACLVALLYGFPDYALALATRAADLTGDGAAIARAAILTWDEQASEPGLPLTIEIKPEQMRMLRRRQTETGEKPTAQLRKALRQWIARP